jgi:hypothetical protein
MVLRAALLLPLLAVAVVSFVLVRVHQGDGGTFVSRQQHAQALTAAGVASVVRVAPDPVTRDPGSQATCSPLGSGGLLNPWRCSIAYRSGRQIQYTVTIRADGSYTGSNEIVRFRGQRFRDTGTITGCCITVP